MFSRDSMSARGRREEIEAYLVLRINHLLLVEISYIDTVEWFSIPLHQHIKVLKCPV